MKKHSKQRSDEASSINSSLYEMEKSFWSNGELMCGIDETGRGCMAGPVVVAAAMLYPGTVHPLIKDSKTLSKQELLDMYQWLTSRCFFTVTIGSPRMIDRYNIYQATARLMRSALIHLMHTNAPRPSLIAVDAMPLNFAHTPYHDIPVLSLIKGEHKSASIAAASIIAKVTRDNVMARMESSFPGYGLSVHKGYCTKMHQSSVLQLQPTIIHRTSFLSWLIKDISNEQTTIFC